MIKHVLEIIETEFKDNWIGAIQFADSTAEPVSANWIHLDIEPISNENLSYVGNSNSRFGIYVICYARNKVQAAALADQVNAFICNRVIDSVYIRTWSPINKGPIGSSYYYKIRIDVDYIS